MLRHKRWGGTAETYASGGMYLHPRYPPDPTLAANAIEGPQLAFFDGPTRSDPDEFERLALVAEPLPDVYPPILSECAVDEHGYFYGPNAHTACAADDECQGARTCNTGTCTGFAGAACCAHASPGSCSADGLCAVCNPHGGEGHTFRMRSKRFPTMYVVPSTRFGPLQQDTTLVYDDSPAAS